MRILSVNYPKQPEDEYNISKLTKAYTASIEPNLKGIADSVRLEPPRTEKSDSLKTSAAFQFKMLMYRNKMGSKRDPMHFRVKIAQTIFMGLICLALFHDQYGYS